MKKRRETWDVSVRIWRMQVRWSMVVIGEVVGGVGGNGAFVMNSVYLPWVV